MSIKALKAKVDRLQEQIQPARKADYAMIFFDNDMPDLDAWLESEAQKYALQEVTHLVMLPKKRAIS